MNSRAPTHSNETTLSEIDIDACNRQEATVRVTSENIGEEMNGSFFD